VAGPLNKIEDTWLIRLSDTHINFYYICASGVAYEPESQFN
jgi:hypothetical protein